MAPQCGLRAAFQGLCRAAENAQAEPAAFLDGVTTFLAAFCGIPGAKDELERRARVLPQVRAGRPLSAERGVAEGCRYLAEWESFCDQYAGPVKLGVSSLADLGLAHAAEKVPRAAGALVLCVANLGRAEISADEAWELFQQAELASGKLTPLDVHEARAAGLSIRASGEELVISGYKVVFEETEATMWRLQAHREEVLAILREQDSGNQDDWDDEDEDDDFDDDFDGDFEDDDLEDEDDEGKDEGRVPSGGERTSPSGKEGKLSGPLNAALWVVSVVLSLFVPCGSVAPQQQVGAPDIAIPFIGILVSSVILRGVSGALFGEKFFGFMR